MMPIPHEQKPKQAIHENSRWSTHRTHSLNPCPHLPPIRPVRSWALVSPSSTDTLVSVHERTSNENKVVLDALQAYIIMTDDDTKKFNWTPLARWTGTGYTIINPILLHLCDHFKAFTVLCQYHPCPPQKHIQKETKVLKRWSNDGKKPSKHLLLQTTL